MPSSIMDEEITGETSGDITNPKSNFDPNLSIETDKTTTNANNSTEETGAKSQAKTKINLPLSKVRNIIKSDPDVSLAGNETVYLMTKMTELFIGHMAKKAYHYTKLGKRKTIQERDVMASVTANDELSFLEGILDSNES